MAKRKALHEISRSSLEHNRSRYADRAPAARTKGFLGPPSPFLNAAEVAMWRQLVNAAPENLGSSDRSYMEIASRLKAKFAAGTISAREVVVLMSTLKELGFAGLDRRPKESKSQPNEFTEFV